MAARGSERCAIAADPSAGRAQQLDDLLLAARSSAWAADETDLTVASKSVLVWPDRWPSNRVLQVARFPSDGARRTTSSRTWTRRVSAPLGPRARGKGLVPSATLRGAELTRSEQGASRAPCERQSSTLKSAPEQDVFVDLGALVLRTEPGNLVDHPGHPGHRGTRHLHLQPRQGRPRRRLSLLYELASHSVAEVPRRRRRRRCACPGPRSRPPDEGGPQCRSPASRRRESCASPPAGRFGGLLADDRGFRRPFPFSVTVLLNLGVVDSGFEGLNTGLLRMASRPSLSWAARWSGECPRER